ncbi:hypothetical protein P9578_15100 [Brevibacillus choshinensis]|uniref:hypothetical protein n=1 Tax=Brevibacillus choshinensis TaxID=54911 RepID=UPI002E1CA2EE|nr:hypothetical protein [Brevibacillus choshinensis]
MKTIRTVINGQLQSVPALTTKQLSAISKIQSGNSPWCAPDILRDLVEAGLVKEVQHGE